MSPLRLLVALGALVALALGARVAVPGPDGVVVAGHVVPEVCSWRLAGEDCPGCGATRASLSLLRGDVGGAFAAWPAVFPLALLLALRLLRPRGSPRGHVAERALVVLVLLVAVASWALGHGGLGG